jgi:hypothetical protein
MRLAETISLPAVPARIQAASNLGTDLPNGSRPSADRPLPATRSTFDGGATICGWIDNVGDVEFAFERLARPLVHTLARMKQARPDIMDQPFDLVNHGGRLSVVDTQLGDDDRAWIEKVVNGDGTLGLLAEQFNRQVVRSYDTDHGCRDVNGALVERTGFTDDSGRRIDYAGLSESVDDSVKLLSLLHDVESTSLRGGMRESHRYRMGGVLVQNYIEGELTEYVKGPDGVGTLRSARGSLLRWDFWA